MSFSRKTILGIGVIAALIALLVYVLTPPKPEPAPSPIANRAVTENKIIKLPNQYTSSAYKFSIKYPANWQHSEPRPGNVIFTGKSGTLEANLSVIAGLIPFQDRSGIYASVETYIDYIKKTFQDANTNPSVLDEGNITITQENGKVINGHYLVIHYDYKNEEYTQYQVIINNNDAQHFYVIAYNAPATMYDANFPIVKAMVESFRIE